MRSIYFWKAALVLGKDKPLALLHIYMFPSSLHQISRKKTLSAWDWLKKPAALLPVAINSNGYRKQKILALPAKMAGLIGNRWENPQSCKNKVAFRFGMSDRLFRNFMKRMWKGDSFGKPEISFSTLFCCMENYICKGETQESLAKTKSQSAFQNYLKL